MSSLWQMRHRLLLEQLDELADWLGGAAPREEWRPEDVLVQPLAAAVMLMRQHRVDKRGRCRFCGRPRFGLRFWLFRRGISRCTVYRAFDLTMRPDPDVAWWQIFAAQGRERNLAEVRRWLACRAQR